jgi:hypothetical protein
MVDPTAPRDDTELRRDVRNKLDGPARDVAQILHNLAKTARSFGFYSRENKAIALFLQELFDGFDTFLNTHGSIRLLVGADRFQFGQHEVYHDADRENGLPFRLFRDGIRAVQFKPGLTVKEVESLLDIFAKRSSTGRDAEEDDVVTLLWKKSFEHVTYNAVEGFTHDLHAVGSFDEDGRPKADTGEAIPRMMERIAGKRDTLLARVKESGSRDKFLVESERGPGGPPRPASGATRSAAVGEEGGGRVMASFRDAEAEAIVAEGLDAAGKRRGARKTKVRSGGETAAMETVDEPEMAGSGFVGASFAAGLYPGARDYPLVLRGGMAEIRFNPIDFHEIDHIRQELDEENQIGLLHLLDYCFELSLQEPEFFEVSDFRPMIGPIRRYLIRNRDLVAYDRLLRYLRRIAAGGVYPEHLTRCAEEMMAECSGGDSLGALVAAATGDEETENLAWDILQQLLPNLESAEVLKLLGHGMSEHMANILAGTLIRTTGSELDLYQGALEGDHVPAALASLRCLATLRTVESIELVEKALGWNDPIVRRAVVRILGRVPLTDRAPRVFRQALEDAEFEVRDEALMAIDRQGDPRLGQTLFRWFAESGFRQLDEITRRRVVGLVAEIDPEYATRVLSDRIKLNVRSRMGGLVGTPDVIEWNRLAVEGLAIAATPGAIEKLRQIRTKGTEDFRELVTRRLVDARRRSSQA